MGVYDAFQPWEDKLIREEYPIYGCFLAGLSRSPASIRLRAYRLGVKKQKLEEHAAIVKFKPELVSDYEKLGMTRQELVKKYNKQGITEHAIRCMLKGRFRKPNNIQRWEVINKRREASLNKDKEQVILGSLLGDTSLSAHRNTYVLACTHGKKQHEYIKHKAEIIGCKVYKVTSGESFAKDKFKYRISYQNKSMLDKIARVVLRANEKYVNTDWLSRITSQGLAYWFMDDGSSSFCKGGPILVRFSCNGFSFKETILLKDFLSNKGFESTITQGKNGGTGYCLALRQFSVNPFMHAISPFIYKSMQYKIKFRGKANE